MRGRGSLHHEELETEGCSIRKAQTSLGQKSKLRVKEKRDATKASQASSKVKYMIPAPACSPPSTQFVSQAAASRISLLAGCSLVTLVLWKQRQVHCKFKANWNNIVKICLKTKQASLGFEGLNYIPLIQQQTCWIQDKNFSHSDSLQLQKPACRPTSH